MKPFRPKKRFEDKCDNCREKFFTRRLVGETRKRFCSTKCQQEAAYKKRKKG